MNFTKHLHQNPSELHKASALEPSGTSPNLLRQKPSGISQGLCPGTLRNLTTHLHLDPPEPHQVAAPETSGTSQDIFTGTPGASAGIFTGTLRKLHRIAPELIWAKDPIAKFCCWGKMTHHLWLRERLKFQLATRSRLQFQFTVLMARCSADVRNLPGQRAPAGSGRASLRSGWGSPINWT